MNHLQYFLGPEAGAKSFVGSIASQRTAWYQGEIARWRFLKWLLGTFFLLFRDALTIFSGRRVDESKRASCGLTAVRQNHDKPDQSDRFRTSRFLLRISIRHLRWIDLTLWGPHLWGSLGGTSLCCLSTSTQLGGTWQMHQKMITCRGFARHFSREIKEVHQSKTCNSVTDILKLKIIYIMF